MSDSTLNRFVSRGTTAQRTAFTPSAPTPSSGPSPGYLWWDTDLQAEYAYDFLSGSWKIVVVASSSSVVVQVKNTQTGAVATGTTAIPLDDTIPQNTEGDQYMTLAITPTSASNKLLIDVRISLSATGAVWTIAALFQDSTANALAVGYMYDDTSTGVRLLSFQHYMTAGTTSATTFKVRGGVSGGGATMTFNGISGARQFGGVIASSITITEIIP